MKFLLKPLLLCLLLLASYSVYSIAKAQALCPTQAINDTANTIEDAGSLSINVLANDPVCPGEIELVVLTQPANGFAAIGANNEIVYTSQNPHFSGCETFTYAINNNPNPTAANDDYATTMINTAVNIAVLNNDTDPQMDPLTPSLVPGMGTTNGTIVLNPDGQTFNYTPNAGFSGRDQFTYQVTDGNGNTDQAVVVITVRIAAPSTVHYIPPKWNLGVHASFPTRLWISTDDPDGANFTITRGNGTTVTGSVTATTTFRYPSPTTTLPAGEAQTTSINTILSQGLKITSDNPTNVQIVQDNSNGQSFLTSKSLTSLGTTFYAGQQVSINGYETNGRSIISVMATENNTDVTITTPPGTTFNWDGTTSATATVTLNANQTYSVGINNATRDLTGAKIVSSKPIAVASGSFGSRMGTATDNGWDQLVPVEVVGKQYIVVSSNSIPDVTALVATENGTVISVDGVSVGTFNAGQKYLLDLQAFGIRAAIRNVTATKPIYAYQNSGRANGRGENGLALIAPVNLDGRGFARFRAPNPGATAVPMIITSGASSFSTMVLTRLNANGTTTNIPLGTPTVVPNAPNLAILEISLTRDEEYRIQSNTFVQLQMFAAQAAGGGISYISAFTPSVLNASNDLITVVQNNALTFNPLANDVDGNGDPITISSIAPATNGTVVNLGNGLLRYTPDAGYSGPDAFIYTITDGNNNFSAATVNINVVPLGSLPTATVRVNVNPVPDNPGLNAADVAGMAGQPVATNITIAGSPDTDGSETLAAAVTISGVPANVTFSAGSNQGGGVWSIPRANLPGLTATSTSAQTVNFNVCVVNSDAAGCDTDGDGINNVATQQFCDPMTITFNCAITIISATPTGVICPGASDGSITVDASCIGCTGALTYSRNGTDYQSSNVLENLAAGTYTISVRDASNVSCNATQMNVVVAPGVDTQAPTAVCNDITVELDVNGNYSLTAADIASISAGSTDNCTVSANLVVSVAQTTFGCNDIIIPPTPPSIWINELHYDNAGGDTGEFVEIAGSSGYDLTGHRLIFYNGANSETYATEILSGTLPNQSNTFGTLNFPMAGIQNGNPDGIAFVDDNDDVIQFISYGGVITAANGPAAGLTSTDIGVTENGSTPIGSSLQLTGSGNLSSDFTWSGPAAESPGAINNGQSFPPPPGVVIISVTDEAGLTSNCGVRIVVEDNIPPTFNCPSAMVVDLNADCELEIPDLISGLAVNDNCSAVLSQSPLATLLVQNLNDGDTQAVTITATDPSGNTNATACSVTLTANNPATVAISDATVNEFDSGTTTYEIPVTLTNPGCAFSVDYATADNGAVAGDDYVATSGTLNFSAGESSQMISVTVNGDLIIEADELFFVNLSNATNGVSISDNQGLGTIINDDFFTCPTIGALADPADICVGADETFAVTGLLNMGMTDNLVQDFGLQLVAYPGTTPPADPYSAGTALGSVAFSGLTNGATEATFSAGSTLAVGDYTICTILDPVPADAACRPAQCVEVRVNDRPMVEDIVGVQCSDLDIGAQAILPNNDQLEPDVENWRYESLVRPAGLTPTNGGTSTDPANYPFTVDNLGGRFQINNDRYQNLTAGPLDVVYAIVPISPEGCEGEAFTVTITINPEPIVEDITGVQCSDLDIGAQAILPNNDQLEPDVENWRYESLVRPAGLTPTSGETSTDPANYPFTVDNLGGRFQINNDRYQNLTAGPLDVVYAIVPISPEGCEGEAFTVTITINPNPVANNTTLTVCEDALGSEQGDFTLTDAEDAGAAANTDGVDVDNGATGVTVTYYASLSDAQAGAGNTITGMNLSAADSPVYARVTNNATSCFSTAEISLVIVDQPNAGASGGSAAACNNSAGGITMVDLNTLLSGADVNGTFTANAGNPATVTLSGSLVDFNGQPAGNYAFTYTVSPTSPCVAATAEVSVAVAACFECPLIGDLSGPAATCIGESRDLSATGLINMAMSNNNVQNFGIRYVYFSSPTTDPYTGGTDLGTVGFGALENGNSEANFQATFPSTAGEVYVYAVLSPTPLDVICRPAQELEVLVLDCGITNDDDDNPLITDPCSCKNNATTTENGQFDELIQITNAPAGQLWTVVQVDGLFTTASPAPPAAPAPITIGTQLTEAPTADPNISEYNLFGIHVDAIGFSIMVSNGPTTLALSNRCYYPNPSFDNLAAAYCRTSADVTLMGSAQLGDGSGEAQPEMETFMVINLDSGQTVVNDTEGNAVLNISNLPAGRYRVIYTFDALDDDPDQTHPGCSQSVEREFELLEVGCGTFPWSGQN